jgi:hypothetical protein
VDPARHAASLRRPSGGAREGIAAAGIWRAILTDALKLVLHGENGTPEERDQARRWINDLEWSGVGSFVFACGVLDLDPSAVRAAVRTPRRETRHGSFQHRNRCGCRATAVTDRTRNFVTSHNNNPPELEPEAATLLIEELEELAIQGGRWKLRDARWYVAAGKRAAEICDALERSPGPPALVDEKLTSIRESIAEVLGNMSERAGELVHWILVDCDALRGIVARPR